jgi:protein ImuB
MTVPSYDDLTPSIPDISFKEGLANVVRLLPEQTSATPLGSWGVEELGNCRYACLRSVRSPQNIFAIARDFSPRIQRYGPSCIVLDVSGLGRLIGDGQAIGAELEREAAARGGSIRIAGGPTQTAVRLLTLAYPGLTIAAADSLADVPIPVLRPWFDDEGPVTAKAKAAIAAHQKRLDTFQRWGLKTLGEIAALPAADLSERMGQDGLALQRLARGLDTAPLVPDPGVPRFVEALELEWPIDALEPLSFVLARLLDPLAAALERADRGAAAIRLALRLVDRTTHQRVLLLPAAMRDPRVLRTLLLLDLESHPPSAAIDIVTIEADPAPSRIVQYSLLERAMPSPETLATLNARLGALVGEDRCGSPSLLDTHRPDGFAMRRFDPEGKAPALPAEDLLHPDRGAVSHPCSVLRRFRPPIAVRVRVERGRPAHVEIDRRGMPGGGVAQASGPWRTSGGWWEPGAAPSLSSGPWDRDEWDVEFPDSVICRLFRDRLSGHWFIDGIVD